MCRLIAIECLCSLFVGSILIEVDISLSLQSIEVGTSLGFGRNLYCLFYFSFDNRDGVSVQTQQVRSGWQIVLIGGWLKLGSGGFYPVVDGAVVVLVVVDCTFMAVDE